MQSVDSHKTLKERIFNIIQIGDKSNRISRGFDIFITITILLNIAVTFLQTFEQLSNLRGFFDVVEYVTILIFCGEYLLRIWTADYLYPEKRKTCARLRFLISFDGVVDFLTIVPVFFLSGFPHASGGTNFSFVPAQCEVRFV